MQQNETGMKLGISACLLGHKVRFDGGHKLDRFLSDTLGEYVDYVPVCPEVECGLGVPRETMRLVGNPDAPQLVSTHTQKDFTEQMAVWARQRVRELEQENLCGFIFKSKSPSSGMERVKVYDENGVPRNSGVGVFARAFMSYFPLMPVEEEGRLHDPRLRENFVERIFVFRRWRELLQQKKSFNGLVSFHTRHKLLVLAHSPKSYQAMGRLVARAKAAGIAESYRQYQALLMESLSLMATTRKITNVLQHMMGYFKKQLTPDEKQELLEVIDHYHHEYVPLVVPLTLINHYVRKYDQPYLREQLFLNPHPLELKLRNHA